MTTLVVHDTTKRVGGSDEALTGSTPDTVGSGAWSKISSGPDMTRKVNYSEPNTAATVTRYSNAQDPGDDVYDVYVESPGGDDGIWACGRMQVDGSCYGLFARKTGDYAQLELVAADGSRSSIGAQVNTIGLNSAWRAACKIAFSGANITCTVYYSTDGSDLVAATPFVRTDSTITSRGKGGLMSYDGRINVFKVTNAATVATGVIRRALLGIG